MHLTPPIPEELALLIVGVIFLILAVCFLIEWRLWENRAARDEGLIEPSFLAFFTHWVYYSPNPHVRRALSDSDFCQTGCPYCAVLHPENREFIVPS